MKKVATIFLAVIFSSMFLYAQQDTSTSKEVKWDSLSEESMSDSAASDSASSQKAEVKADASDSSKAKAGADSISTGSLNINTDPEGVMVEIDGIEKGQTPLTIDGIPSGKHSLKLKMVGYFLKKVTVEVYPGASEDLNFTLTRPVGLVIKSDPSQAEVFLDDQRAGKTPYENFKLKPGEYTVKIKMQGYEVFQEAVSIQDGATDTLDVKLIKSAAAAAQKETKSTAKPESDEAKSRKKSVLNKVSLGIFIAFCLIILLVELAGSE